MHLVGFVIRVYHDARSSECQLHNRLYEAVMRSIRRTPSQLHSQQHISTQHDMLSQTLFTKTD